jgi:hypothetical protein
MKIKLIKFLTLALILSSCSMEPERDNTLKILNASNYEISVDYVAKEVPDYPSYHETDFYLNNSFKPGDTLSLTVIDDKTWRQYFQSHETINIFVYKLDTIKKYGDIDAVIKAKRYSKHLVTEKELDVCNWVFKLNN